MLSSPVSEPLTNRGVLLSTLRHAILHPSHHLLNVLIQIANKLGLSKKKTCPDYNKGKDIIKVCENMILKVMTIFIGFRLWYCGGTFRAQ
jgi:hypothetical protein